MKRTSDTYISRNFNHKDEFDIQFKLGNTVKSKTNLDIWLTERYALFQDADNDINEYEVHHPELPL
ncbi:DUF2071 domain-containing protein [Aquimarina sp. M1]